LRTHIAGMMTMAVGALLVGSATGQGAQAPQKRTSPPVEARPSAAPVDPKVVRTQQLAAEKSRQEMSALLAEWEKQSRKITSLDVGFDRVVSSKAWGEQWSKGRAMLRSPDLACLEFQKYKVDKDGKPTNQVEPQPTERIVCTGREVLQYFWDEKVVYVHPLEKDVRQKALQQGPLPFLFNMKAAEARQRYSMTLINQDEKEYLIAVVPNELIDKEAFSKAFLWLNKETFLPGKLRLYPTQGEKELEEFRFKVIQPNKPMESRFFEPDLKMADWKVIHNPGGNDPRAQVPLPQGGALRATPKRPTSAQPAMRPSAGTR